MDTLDIVTVIAIILFARLGVRLVSRYLSEKDDEDNEDETNSE